MANLKWVLGAPFRKSQMAPRKTMYHGSMRRMKSVAYVITR